MGVHRMSARGSAKRKTIEAGRVAYNLLRKKAGLDPITNWSERPPREELIQFKEKDSGN